MSEMIENKSKERQSNIELMRIVAMIMIVGCHFATHGGFSFKSGSITIPRLWWHILELGGNFGTDVFVMISGYFLISNSKVIINKQKVFVFWLQIFFYSVIIFFLSFPLGYGDLSIESVGRSFLPITFSTWWFASSYFVLYLLHPYFNLALNAMNEKQYKGFLILLLLIWSLIPTITTQQFQANDLLQLFLIYSIAGYIRRFRPFQSLNSINWACIWVISSILTFISAIILLYLGQRWPIASSHSTYFYGQTSLLTIIRAVSFFMMFLKMNVKNRRWINKISSTMFGVYLFHDSKLLRSFLWNDVFHNADYENSIMIIPWSIFAVIVVVVCGVLIDILRQSSIELFVKKMINKKMKKRLCLNGHVDE